MTQVSSKQLYFFRQVFVIGMACGGNGINAGFCNRKYLYAIAIGRGDGIGKTALEVHNYPSTLEEQEREEEQY